MGKYVLTKVNGAKLCLFALLLWISPVWAAGEDIQCDSRDAILAAAESQCGEHVVAGGIDKGGMLVELLASESGATWAIIITGPNGRTCVADFGTDWRGAPADSGSPV